MLEGLWSCLCCSLLCKHSPCWKFVISGGATSEVTTADLWSTPPSNAGPPSIVVMLESWPFMLRIPHGLQVYWKDPFYRQAALLMSDRAEFEPRSRHRAGFLFCR